MTNIAIEPGHRKFVDLPIKNDDFPWQNVSLPEGTIYFWVNYVATSLCEPWNHDLDIGKSFPFYGRTIQVSEL